MDIRHLRYFVATAELGSIAKAGAALHVTQPTLSRQLADLERSVGALLLHRTTRGVSLTAAGRGLVHQARAVIEQVDRIPESVQAASRERTLVHVGIPPGLPHRWFHAVQHELAGTAPSVELSLHEGTTEQQRRMLVMGSIHLGLIRSELPELSSSFLFTQLMGCALPPDSPLATRRSVGLVDLTGFRVLAHSSQETPGQEALFRAAALDDGIDISWVFRPFAEHSELIAQTAEVHAALVVQASAVRRFSTWSWVPMSRRTNAAIADVRTRVAWRDLERLEVRQTLEAMRAATAGLAARDGHIRGV